MKPKPIITEAYVLACFSQAEPRFLKRDSRGNLCVTLKASEAVPFPSAGAAGKALGDFTKKANIWGAGSWSVYAMATRATFAEVEPETTKGAPVNPERPQSSKRSPLVQANR